MHRLFRLVVALACAVAVAPAGAQSNWPEKPIRLIVSFPAGGQLDVVSRFIADRLAPVLGQPIVIEVKPGADGNIGAELAAKADPDGYTWYAASPPTTIQPSVRPKTLRYDPIRDFEPVAFIGTSPFLFVVPASLPVTSLADFVAYAKARPGALSYAGSARGTVVHLATELFKHEAGVSMEMIGYKGQPDAIPDLISGRVLFMSMGLTLAAPQIKAGKLRALAVLERQRDRHLAEVPSIAEVGYPDLTMSTWFGIAMPHGTPASIVQRVNAEIAKVLQSPEAIAKLDAMGVVAARPQSPAEFGAFLKSDAARWKNVVRDANIELD
jgi:tripartite-type tricarboxylate transporter receptor subunit TctC